MDIVYTKTVPESKWFEIISNAEDSYFFQTPAWAKILANTFGFQTATRLYEIDGSEVLIPMMESKRYGLTDRISMPFGYGGIFSSADIPSDAIQGVLKSIVGGRCLSFDLILPPFYNVSIEESTTIKQKDTEWNYTHVLSLDGGFQDVWRKRFDRNIKRRVRQAEQQGIEVIEGRSLEDFKAYYEVYREAAENWGYKEPAHPLRFYESMCKFGRPCVKLRLAVKEDRVIAGKVDFHYGKDIVCWGSASLTDYKMYHADPLLHKASIEDACNKGYRRFNFGASGNMDGVRIYKEKFGAERVDFKSYTVLSRLGKIADLAITRRFR